MSTYVHPLLETSPRYSVPWPLPSYSRLAILEGGCYIYILWDSEGDCVYVGQTINLAGRIRRHSRNKAFALWEAWQVDRGERMRIESELINHLNPAVFEDGTERAW